MFYFAISFLIVLLALVILAFLLYFYQPSSVQTALSIKPSFIAPLNTNQFRLYPTNHPLTYRYELDMNTNNIYIYNYDQNELAYTLNNSRGTFTLKGVKDKELLENNGFYVHVNESDDYKTFELSGVLTKF